MSASRVVSVVVSPDAIPKTRPSVKWRCWQPHIYIFSDLRAAVCKVCQGFWIKNQPL